jgi:hypothetical protein
MTDRMGAAMDQRYDAKKAGRALWSRLRGVLSAGDRSADDGRAPSIVKILPASTAPARAAAVGAVQVVEHAGVSENAPERGILLCFPIHGEALLVKLADLLRKRIADRGPRPEPLLLMMSRCPGSRLSIDRTAYVEFDADRCAYHVAIEAAPDTKVTLETTDFDTVVKFVVQYVTERFSGPAALEVAS